MDYDYLDELRKNASLDMSVTETHGGIFCILCFGSDRFEEFIPSDQSDDTTSISLQIKEYREALSDLVTQDDRSLGEGGLDFELIIPSDSYSVVERAEGLSIWGQGFLDGVTFLMAEQIIEIDRNKSKESFEIIEDFTQISRLDPHSIKEEVDDELALMELIEFVRLSVQMIYDDFRVKQ